MSKKNLFPIFLCLILASTVAGLEVPLKIDPETNEEALFIRRVIEFWKDGDFKLAKTQILQFLKENPDSSLEDQLYALLGDLYLRENNLQEAVRAFACLQSSTYREKVLLSHLQCLFELQDYPQMTTVASFHFESGERNRTEQEKELSFLYGEALFRSGLLLADSQKKTELFNAAKEIYEELMDTPYELTVLPSLAFIYKTLDEKEKAISAWQRLSRLYPEKKEEYLFQSACMEAKCDREKAVDSFHQIMEMKGKLAKEAAFNRFILLYEMERFEEAIRAKETLSQADLDKKPQLDYAIGSSYFALADYQHAIPFLKSFCDDQQSRGDASEKFLSSINYLISCAHHQEDLLLFYQTLACYRRFFPNDPNYAKALFLRGMLAKRKGDLSIAEEDFGMIIKRFPQFEDNEKLFLEYGFIAFDKKEWENAYQRFTFFLREFPKNPHRTAVLRYLLNTSLHLVQSTPSSIENSYSKSDFEKDLKTILQEPGVLTEEEQKEYRFLLAKTVFELKKFEEAVPLFQTVVREQKSATGLAEAHLLLAYCYKNCSNIQSFCDHLEQALECREEYKKSGQLHLELFNAYLQLSQTNRELLGKGAAHLYVAQECDSLDIQFENRVWLADYFLSEAKKTWSHSLEPLSNDDISVKRAKKLFMSLFHISDQNPKLLIPDHQLYLENEVFKFANLLQLQGEGKAVVTLFEDLIEIYQKSPDLGWQRQTDAYLELGKSYAREHLYEKAISTFNILLSKTAVPPTLIAETALLERCKAQFAALEPDENDEKIEAILTYLKQLQVRKQPAFEPVHLESALEYARMRSLLVSEEKRVETYLFFLKRFQEDFSESSEDVLSKKYFSVLNRYPDKRKLVDLYLKYAAAEISYTRDCLAKESSKEALKAWQPLLEEKEILTPWLREKIAKIFKQAV